MNQAKQFKSTESNKPTKQSESKDSNQESKPAINLSKAYLIAREGSGYVVLDATGAKRSTENMLILTLEALRKLIKSDMEG